MPANLLQIVDGPSASPTVVVDLNNETVFGAADVDVSPPRLRYSVSSSMMRDGSNISQSSYENRELRFTFDVISASQDAWAASFQTLARAVDQDRFWVRYQPTGMTNPVFFNCHRASPDQVEDVRGAVAYRTVSLTVQADPAAYGLAEDVTFTITNDPTSGTNKMMYAFGAVKGDLETPLILGQTSGPGVTVDAAGTVGYLCGYSLSGGSTHAFLARDLTELTSVTDTGSTVTGAGTSYIGGNYKACTFATTPGTPLTRLQGTFTTALTPMPGTYRMLLRMVAPSSGALAVSNTTSIRVRTDGSAVFRDVGDPVTTDFSYGGAAQSFLLDFGLVQLPPGTPIGGAGLAPNPTTTPAPYFQIVASQTSAGGGIRYDEVFLLPTDTNYGDATTALVKWPTWSASTPLNVITFDGIKHEMVTRYDASGTDPFGGLPVPAKDMSWVGGLPTVRPGYNNYVQFLYNALLVTGTAAFTARYYPRYLYVRPATT